MLFGIDHRLLTDVLLVVGLIWSLVIIFLGCRDQVRAERISKQLWHMRTVFTETVADSFRRVSDRLSGASYDLSNSLFQSSVTTPSASSRWSEAIHGLKSNHGSTMV